MALFIPYNSKIDLHKSAVQLWVQIIENDTTYGIFTFQNDKTIRFKVVCVFLAAFMFTFSKHFFCEYTVHLLKM